MQKIEITLDELLDNLFSLSQSETVCILDSCGRESLGSKYLIAGISPKEIFRLDSPDPSYTLLELDKILTDRETAAIFTISYDFGRKLLNIGDHSKPVTEPDVFVAVFENLILYDYLTGEIKIEGIRKGDSGFIDKLVGASRVDDSGPKMNSVSGASSNFSKSEYLSKIELVKSEIRSGNTYQTNLTQSFTVPLDPGLSPQKVFQRLRQSHPAAFAAFLSRGEDFVLSISPERFLAAEADTSQTRRIISSPIKGTRNRGGDIATDKALRKDLLTSEKDRAENTMIVDLIRNDLGRLCEFGSVRVEKLCELEEHPTLFHLVSTVSGQLRPGVYPSEIIRAIFPCGSITGCPKIRTMEIIDELENKPRGLSMGSIGYSGFDNRLDMNVAIRTMVITDRVARFNTGGGIVIDSDPEAEWEESMLKAKAMLAALNPSS